MRATTTRPGSTTVNYIALFFDTYQEAEKFFTTKLNALKREKNRLDPKIYFELNRINQYESELYRVFFKGVFKMSEIAKTWIQLNQQIKRFKRYLILAKIQFQVKIPANSRMAAIAKQYPIKQLVQQFCDVKNHYQTTYLCPLHTDKDPSLKIYPATNTWYCFGCHAGGSPINFVMQYKDLSFNETLQFFKELI